jgi:hypothetical protein
MRDAHIGVHSNRTRAGMVRAALDRGLVSIILSGPGAAPSKSDRWKKRS